MIKLEAAQMTKAIERAKAARPRVRVISAAERTYSVIGSKGDAYTVRFAVANGHKLAECDCPARGLCYHIAAAASVNIAVQSMRRQGDKSDKAVLTPATDAAPAPTRESLISAIKQTWSRRFPGESLADELMARFRRNQLEMLSTDFLVAIQNAIA
jgi:uncharacterized Zn finger protein